VIIYDYRLLNLSGNSTIYNFMFLNPPQLCGTAVDCELSDWSEWDACSCSCNGIRQRSRHIEQYPAYMGKETRHILESRLYSAYMGKEICGVRQKQKIVMFNFSVIIIVFKLVNLIKNNSIYSLNFSVNPANS
jgi:hypothetical protein